MQVDQSRRRRWSIVLAALTAVAVLALGIWQAVQLLDPDKPVRDAALRDIRAYGQLDWAQVWSDHSGCWQRRHPEAEWIRAQEVVSPLGETPHQAPADTDYEVVAITSDGYYRRVEMRVHAPGRPLADIELDYRQYGGRWILVDGGSLGHRIADDCRGAFGQ